MGQLLESAALDPRPSHRIPPHSEQYHIPDERHQGNEHSDPDVVGLKIGLPPGRRTDSGYYQHNQTYANPGPEPKYAPIGRHEQRYRVRSYGHHLTSAVG